MKLLLQQKPRWSSSSKACSRFFFLVIFSLQQSLYWFSHSWEDADWLLNSQIGLWTSDTLDWSSAKGCAGFRTYSTSQWQDYFVLVTVIRYKLFIDRLHSNSQDAQELNDSIFGLERMRKQLRWKKKKQGQRKALKDMVWAWWYVKMIMETTLLATYTNADLLHSKKKVFALRNICTAKVKIITHIYKTKRSVWRCPSAFCCVISSPAVPKLLC